MSVAVSPYLLPSQTLGLPASQQTDLLDALLASCQKSTMNPRLPGYGRSLQPYFTTEIVPNMTPQPTKTAQPLKGKSKKAKGKANSASASSSSDEDTSHVRQKISKSPVSPSKAVVVHDSVKGQTIKAIHNQKKTGQHPGHAWAGPAFGMAPAASEIPAPSDFLLFL